MQIHRPQTAAWPAARFLPGAGGLVVLVTLMAVASVV
jgi:hypothetical protein